MQLNSKPRILVMILIGVLGCLILNEGCERYWTEKLAPEKLAMARDSLALWLLPRGRPKDDPNAPPEAQSHESIWELYAAPSPSENFPGFLIDSANLVLKSTSDDRQYQPIRPTYQPMGVGDFVGLGTFLVPDSLLGKYRLVGEIYWRLEGDEAPTRIDVDVQASLKTGLEPIYK